MKRSTQIIKTGAPIIAIEGVDGAGKSTLARAIGEMFDGVVIQAFPANRGLPFDLDGHPIESQVLMAFDRLMSQAWLRSAKSNASLVVLDRYKHSGYAYGMAAGGDLDWLINMDKRSLDPDFVIFVDTPINICLRRILDRGEDAPSTPLERIRTCFLEILFHSSICSPTIGAIRLDGSKSLKQNLSFIRSNIKLISGIPLKESKT